MNTIYENSIVKETENKLKTKKEINDLNLISMASNFGINFNSTNSNNMVNNTKNSYLNMNFYNSNNSSHKLFIENQNHMDNSIHYKSDIRELKNQISNSNVNHKIINTNKNLESNLNFNSGLNKVQAFSYSDEKFSNINNFTNNSQANLNYLNNPNNFLNMNSYSSNLANNSSTSFNAYDNNSSNLFSNFMNNIDMNNKHNNSNNSNNIKSLQQLSLNKDHNPENESNLILIPNNKSDLSLKTDNLIVKKNSQKKSDDIIKSNEIKFDDSSLKFHSLQFKPLHKRLNLSLLENDNICENSKLIIPFCIKQIAYDSINALTGSTKIKELFSSGTKTTETKLTNTNLSSDISDNDYKAYSNWIEFVNSDSSSKFP